MWNPTTPYCNKHKNVQLGIGGDCPVCEMDRELAFEEATRHEPTEEQQISWNEAADYQNEDMPDDYLSGME